MLSVFCKIRNVPPIRSGCDLWQSVKARITLALLKKLIARSAQQINLKKTVLLTNIIMGNDNRCMFIAGSPQQVSRLSDQRVDRAIRYFRHLNSFIPVWGCSPQRAFL